VVVGTDTGKIVENSMRAIECVWKECRVPDLWDGLASERIVEKMMKKTNM
jgi:hypothetical protein